MWPLCVPGQGLRPWRRGWAPWASLAQTPGQCTREQTARLHAWAPPQSILARARQKLERGRTRQGKGARIGRAPRPQKGGAAVGTRDGAPATIAPAAPFAGHDHCSNGILAMCCAGCRHQETAPAFLPRASAAGTPVSASRPPLDYLLPVHRKLSTSQSSLLVWRIRTCRPRRRRVTAPGQPGHGVGLQARRVRPPRPVGGGVRPLDPRPS